MLLTSQIHQNVQSTTDTVKLLQGYLSVWDPVDRSPVGSSVPGILQAILEWVAISFFKDLPNPGTEPTSVLSPVMAGGFFTTSATWEAHAICQVQVTCIYSFRFTEYVVKRKRSQVGLMVTVCLQAYRHKSHTCTHTHTLFECYQ